jgi:hypothetical protein
VISIVKAMLREKPNLPVKNEYPGLPEGPACGVATINPGDL